METNTIKCYSAFDMSNETFSRIGELAEKCIKNDVFPYTKDIPVSPNRNVVNGHNLNSIQSVELELFNCLNNNPNQTWIYGADAAMLGLELKSNNKEEYQAELLKNPQFNVNPIILYANVQTKTKSNQKTHSNDSNILKESLQRDCQTCYSLNQFTNKSIIRAFQLRNLKNNLELRGNETFTNKNIESISQLICENFNGNNTTEQDILHRKDVRRNVMQNLNPKGKCFSNVQGNYNSIVFGLNELERKCLNTLFNYFIRQNGYDGGIINQRPASNEDFQKLLNTTKEVNGRKINTGHKKFALIAFSASTFAERLSRYNFSFEPVFTQQEYIESQQNINIDRVKLPAAAIKELPENMLSERTKNKLTKREYQYTKRPDFDEKSRSN